VNARKTPVEGNLSGKQNERDAPATIKRKKIKGGRSVA